MLENSCFKTRPTPYQDRRAFLSQSCPCIQLPDSYVSLLSVNATLAEVKLEVVTSLAGPINAVAGIQQMSKCLPFGISLVDICNSNDHARVRYSGKAAPCIASPGRAPWSHLLIFQGHLKKEPKKSSQGFVQPWLSDLTKQIQEYLPRRLKSSMGLVCFVLVS